MTGEEKGEFMKKNMGFIYTSWRILGNSEISMTNRREEK